MAFSKNRNKLNRMVRFLNYKYFNSQLLIKKVYIASHLVYNSVWGQYNKDKKAIYISPETFMYGNKLLKKTVHHELCHMVHFDHDENFWKLHSKLKI